MTNIDAKLYTYERDERADKSMCEWNNNIYIKKLL